MNNRFLKSRYNELIIIVQQKSTQIIKIYETNFIFSNVPGHFMG